jgi:hypothetical protein
MKDRTNEKGIVLRSATVVTDKLTDDARRRGALESRDGGKHGDPQERTMIEEILTRNPVDTSLRDMPMTSS